MASRKSDCVSCNKNVTNIQHALQCERCQQWQHRLCDSGVSFQEYKLACKGDIDLAWVCRNCTVSVTTRKRKATSVSENEDKRHRTEISLPSAESTRLSATFTSFLPNAIISEEVESISEDFGSFNIPNPVEESSIVDPVPHADAEPDHVTFRIIESSTERSGKTLIDSRGYSYNIKRAGKKIINWRCSIRNRKIYCRATVSESNSEFIEGPQEHCHAPIMGLEAANDVEGWHRKVNEKQTCLPGELRNSKRNRKK